MTWTIMPFINCWEMTRQAIDDVLAQTVETRLLLIDQGSDAETRTSLNQLRMQDPYRERVLAWHFDPGIPLSAAWNRGMGFVEALGGAEAWIVNNDVRLSKYTLEALSRARAARNAYLVSGVGVDQEGWTRGIGDYDDATDFGGPDFSCFLLSVEGWHKYPFDEHFAPAYCEDVDLHRRMMLGGDGQRIFGLNVPFLHYASATVNALGVAAFAPHYERCVAYYTSKWGGKPNEEMYRDPILTPLVSEHQRHEHLGYQGNMNWTTPHLFALEQEIHQAGTLKQTP